jgi:hypothetical protein
MDEPEPAEVVVTPTADIIDIEGLRRLLAGISDPDRRRRIATAWVQMHRPEE